MKTASKILLGAFVVGVMGFNLTLKGEKTNSSDVTLSNIQALQASAVECKCDATNTNACTIEGGGTGTGQLICVW